MAGVLNGIAAVVRMLRLPNLVMVFLTQYIPYWFVLRPAILKAGGIPVLSERTFFLISIATLLTTLGGYVINDYYDRSLDLINKPNRVVWGKWISADFGLLFYSSLVAATHLLAFWIDRELRVDSRWPLWVFPGVSFLLFLYAWQMKCTPLIGNLLVSLLCGIVPVMLIFPEDRPLWLTAFIQPDMIQKALGLVWIFGIFAFLTNLFREQVKDLEDFEGDAACGCMTLAVGRGTRFAKKPAAITGICVTLMTGALMYFWVQTGAPAWKVSGGFMLLLLPCVFATFVVISAKEKKDYTRASALIKIVMFTGLVFLAITGEN